MSRKILMAFFLMAILFAASPAAAKPEKFPQADFSALRPVNSARVAQVIDPYTILLDDKRVIRLGGIDYPDYNDYAAGTFSILARKVLKDMLEGKTVNIYQTKKDNWGRTNRMSQQIAHLELQKGGAWVQGTLLRLGLARVMTDRRTPEMAEQMYAQEQRARDSKTGLWALKKFKILTPEEAESQAGSVEIVEGRIRSTAIKQNRIYLNFGRDWRTDFTITIPPQDRRAFFDRGIDPLQWNGRNVRVRGWIGTYNGPFIEVDHPERIEMIEDRKNPASKPLKETVQPRMLNAIEKN